MPLNKLDHVNLRTTQLGKMIEWYSDILGLVNGDRPKFDMAGAWMYAGETACVHLVDVSSEATGAEVDLKLEHFAFSATDRQSFEALLRERGEAYRTNDIPSINIVQFNVWDPDGNHIHIDFPMTE